MDKKYIKRRDNMLVISVLIAMIISGLVIYGDNNIMHKMVAIIFSLLVLISVLIPINAYIMISDEGITAALPSIKVVTIINWKDVGIISGNQSLVRIVPKNPRKKSINIFLSSWEDSLDLVSEVVVRSPNAQVVHKVKNMVESYGSSRL